jgi:hypothetical protein
MIAIPHDLEQPFLEMANSEHKSPTALLAQLITEALEDYHDARLADMAMDRLIAGESSTVSLEEWSKQLNEMES